MLLCFGFDHAYDGNEDDGDGVVGDNGYGRKCARGSQFYLFRNMCLERMYLGRCALYDEGTMVNIMMYMETVVDCNYLLVATRGSRGRCR